MGLDLARGDLPAGSLVESWHIWRGSPELLAHVIRVAERASGGTETVINVAVADDQEVFSSPSDFVTNVTLDALRHFSSIAILTSGPDMSISIVLRWTRAPEARPWTTGTGQDAEIVVSAHGVDSGQEREALMAVHNAIKRGGTDRDGQRQAFMVGIQALAVVLIMAAFVAILFLAYGGRSADLIAEISTSDNLLNLVFSALILVTPATALGVMVGRWAYPSLEVAERGETQTVARCPLVRRDRRHPRRSRRHQGGTGWLNGRAEARTRPEKSRR